MFRATPHSGFQGMEGSTVKKNKYVWDQETLDMLTNQLEEDKL